MIVTVKPSKEKRRFYQYSNSEDHTDIDQYEIPSEKKPPDDLKCFDSETYLLSYTTESDLEGLEPQQGLSVTPPTRK